MHGQTSSGWQSCEAAPGHGHHVEAVQRQNLFVPPLLEHLQGCVYVLPCLLHHLQDLLLLRQSLHGLICSFEARWHMPHLP